MPKAVSNASPLIHLGRIGHLDLLREFHEQVWIPTAVWREVFERGQGRPEIPVIEQAYQAGWLQQKVVSDTTLVSLLRMQLDVGEGRGEGFSPRLREGQRATAGGCPYGRLNGRFASPRVGERLGEGFPAFSYQSSRSGRSA